MHAQQICEKLGIQPNLILKKNIRGLNGFTAIELINALIYSVSLKEAGELLGYSENPIKQAIRETLLPCFLERKAEFGKGSPGHKAPWCFTLLATINCKKCYKCSNILDRSMFGSDIGKSDLTANICKKCNILKSKERKFYIVERTPEWANIQEIVRMYENCPEGSHVDHELPLRGEYVSGLHVHNNLRYMYALDNIAKGNRVDLDAYNKYYYGT